MLLIKRLERQKSMGASKRKDLNSIAKSDTSPMSEGGEPLFY